MEAERWLQVKQILQETLDRDKADRNAFLLEACADDEELRDEVISLMEEDVIYMMPMGRNT
mgnify:CR=1 FL=1